VPMVHDKDSGCWSVDSEASKYAVLS